ncbi:MAG: hypothetical protein JSS49_28055 [Planctomycetes bacterium]|nr:hypothetical protein [Planctomycetota bacterium]
MPPFLLMLAIACLAAVYANAVRAADPVVGSVVFVKLDATGRVGDKVVEWKDLPFPGQVKEISVHEIRLSRVWVRKTDLMNAEDALRYFSDQIQTEPRRADAWSCRGVVLNVRKETDKAISDQTETIRLAPNDARNFVRRANAWFSRVIEHQFGPLIQVGGFNVQVEVPPEQEIALAHVMVDCCDAIRIDPRCADAYVCRANVRSFKNQLTTARSDYRQAAMLEPGSSRANVELARFLISHPWPARGVGPGLLNSSEAIRCATAACELTDWESFEAVDTLVRACVVAGDRPSAAKWAKTAVALLPESRQQFVRDEYQQLVGRQTDK